MSTATPGALMALCDTCRQPIVWSRALREWVHDATRERDCGPVEVRG